MYIDMLSSALSAWDLDLSDDELVDHAVTCRARMLATGTTLGASAYEALAAELAYDRALMRLCEQMGVTTSVDGFAFPQIERVRLEQALAEKDIDVVALSRERLGAGESCPQH
jgi:hypothetical protein